MTDVSLSWPEIRSAAYGGIDRMIRARAKGFAPAYGVPRDEIAADIIGAIGEVVVAKTIGCYWTGDLGRTDGGAPDIGPFHVRTRPRSDGELILWPNDRDDGPFLLVVFDRLPYFRIVGWCYGREGKVPEFEATTGRPGYFVPQRVLRPLSEFRS